MSVIAQGQLRRRFIIGSRTAVLMADLAARAEEVGLEVAQAERRQLLAVISADRWSGRREIILGHIPPEWAAQSAHSDSLDAQHPIQCAPLEGVFHSWLRFGLGLA